MNRCRGSLIAFNCGLLDLIGPLVYSGMVHSDNQNVNPRKLKHLCFDVQTTLTFFTET